MWDNKSLRYLLHHLFLLSQPFRFNQQSLAVAEGTMPLCMHLAETFLSEIRSPSTVHNHLLLQFQCLFVSSWKPQTGWPQCTPSHRPEGWVHSQHGSAMRLGSRCPYCLYASPSRGRGWSHPATNLPSQTKRA